MSKVSQLLTSEIDGDLRIYYTDGTINTITKVTEFGMAADEEGLFVIFIEGQVESPRHLINMQHVKSIEVIGYESETLDKTPE